MREIINLNDDWQYAPEDGYGNYVDAVAVRLPHTNIELPYNCFNEEIFQFKSRYERTVFIPESAASRRIFIDFEGVMASAEVFIDNKNAGGHAGGYTAFSVEITGLVAPGTGHVLKVITDASENADIPPFGHVIDYLTYGGIYREVRMRITEDVYISNIFAKPGGLAEERKTLGILLTLSDPPGPGTVFSARLCSPDGRCIKSFETGVTSVETELMMDNIEDISLWDINTPVLYTLKTELKKNGTVFDEISTRIGFRSCEFTPEGFFLNGTRLKLRGLNRHQSFPITGYAMPERIQKRDADILKYELGLNTVRTSHYPQSRHFLDRCDEIGLLVFEEIPGWQHIGGERWKENTVKNVREMIVGDRNRPSIVIWGVRINESQDDSGFYSETNRLAHELDETRQTGGVRYIENSELLEDVYTMNDFIHAGDASKNKILRRPARVTRNKVSGRRAVPYLVTEYNGHMFPTKRFDNEERTREHALRHLRVLDRAGSDKRISGAIGWCAFDYNTHREFGSGDRICYHGVSDMFRIPKPAAAVYASQKSPKDGIVLEPATIFAKGERSAVRVLPIEVYTNCDYIRLFRNGTEVGDYYPAASEYPGVEHPPVIIRDLVGSQLDKGRFSSRDRKLIKELISFVMLHGEEALKPVHYIRIGLFMRRNKMNYSELVDMFLKYNTGWGDTEDSFEIAGFFNGTEAVRKKYGSGSISSLEIQADDLKLDAITASGTWDSTRIVFKLTDQYGNIMPFTNEYLHIEIEGPAVIIGPDTAALSGGVYAAWIRTTGESGTVKLSASCSRLKSGSVCIDVSRPDPAEEP